MELGTFVEVAQKARLLESISSEDRAERARAQQSKQASAQSRPASSKWQGSSSPTKSKRNRSNQYASQGSNAKPRACSACGRMGHLQKDCWWKRGLCMRCGESGHMARDCPRGSSSPTKSPRNRSNQSASQGSNAKPGACSACGRMGHLQKDCWWKRGLCMRCGESGHMARDCPRGQVAAPTGPAGSSGA
ncbi:zf-CCHC domain-containing protein/zf-CCHC_4 domain-containing protein, partial [Cephalotus follicularis]